MNALIIGGGVAGSTAAMALQKVGIDATIYEAYATTAHDVGASMGISLNGLDALRTLGAHQAVRDAGFPSPAVSCGLATAGGSATEENGTPLPDGTLPSLSCVPTSTVRCTTRPFAEAFRSGTASASPVSSIAAIK